MDRLRNPWGKPRFLAVITISGVTSGSSITVFTVPLPRPRQR